MAGCLTLTILGGAAEIGGFVLVWVELVLTQRREFPGYRPIHHRALTWVRRKLGRHKSSTVHLSGLVGSATASGTATLTVTSALATTLEERIARVEVEMRDLQRKQQEDHVALEGRIADTQQRITYAEAGLQEQINDLEASRKESLRDSLTFEKWGVGLFVVGVILSVLGNAVTC